MGKFLRVFGGGGADRKKKKARKKNRKKQTNTPHMRALKAIFPYGTATPKKMIKRLTIRLTDRKKLWRGKKF